MKVYVIYDTIALKPVTTFVASNDADRDRFLTVNFKDAPKDGVSGFVCYSVHSFIQEDHLNFPVVVGITDYVQEKPQFISPSISR